MQFDLTQFYGVAGAPTIERIVQYLRDQWRLPVYLAPLASVLFGILVNVGLALGFHLPLEQAVLVGTFTGFVASGWHEVAKDDNRKVQ